MKTKQQQKRDLADKILQNPVYQPESGLYVRLHSVLTRLPFDDLRSLELVLSMKEPQKNKPFSFRAKQ